MAFYCISNEEKRLSVVFFWSRNYVKIIVPRICDINKKECLFYSCRKMKVKFLEEYLRT